MQDLTTGSVTRHLLKTSSFMLVTMVFQTLYFLVDLYWVGRLGKEAVAAVAVAGNLTFVVLALSQMLGVGTTTVVSHAAGRKDRDRAVLLFNQSQVLSLVCGVVFLVVMMALRLSYTRVLSADATTAALAADYLLWFIPAMSLQFAMVAMGSALRGTGNFKPGMIVQTTTVVVNMVLAPILIFGWFTGYPMGVAGAAISTLVAVVVGVLWLSRYFTSGNEFLHFRWADWPPRFETWASMLKIGLPAGAEFALMAVYLFIVYTVCRPFGASAQAAFGIGLRLVQSMFLPVVALAFAAGPVAGQNVGARKADRVRTTFLSAVGMAVGFTVISALLWLPGGRTVHADLLARSRRRPHRRGVPAHRGVELRRLRRGVRVLEHVPGARQHRAAADHVGQPHHAHRHPDHHPVAAAGIRADDHLVHLDRRHRRCRWLPTWCCCSANSTSGSRRSLPPISLPCRRSPL